MKFLWPRSRQLARAWPRSKGESTGKEGSPRWGKETGVASLSLHDIKPTLWDELSKEAGWASPPPPARNGTGAIIPAATAVTNTVVTHGGDSGDHRSDHLISNEHRSTKSSCVATNNRGRNRSPGSNSTCKCPGAGRSLARSRAERWWGRRQRPLSVIALERKTFSVRNFFWRILKKYICHKNITTNLTTCTITERSKNSPFLHLSWSNLEIQSTEDTGLWKCIKSLHQHELPRCFCFYHSLECVWLSFLRNSKLAHLRQHDKLLWPEKLLH